jgi:PRTRC genetic system protein E
MSGFFTAIHTYALQANLNMMISSVASGKLSVILMTKNKAGNAEPALNSSQKFVGTPQELDDQFIAALACLGEGYKSLEETIAAVKTIQDDAKQAVVAKAGEKIAKPAASASASAPAAAPAAPAASGSASTDEADAGEADPENLFANV